MKTNKTLVIIDGHALLHRAYHALPPLTTQQGVLINGAYGFFLVFLKMISEIKPDYLVCCFDLAAKTFRHKKYKDYKAHRVRAPEELYQQLEIIKEVLKAFEVPVFEKKGFEADDLIGTIVKKTSPKKLLKAIILTGDLDTLQLVNQKVNVYTLGRGMSQSVVYDESAVKKRFALTPEQMVDYKALKGDPSDNIPGVAGVGEKTATQLLQRFGSLRNLYEAIQDQKAEALKPGLRQKLIDNHDQAFFSQELVKINCQAPIKFSLKQARFIAYDQQKVKQVFQKYEFFSLIKRLPLSTALGVAETDLGKPGQKASQVQAAGQEEQKIFDQIENLYQQKIFSAKIRKLEKALVPIISQMQSWGMRLDVDYLTKLSGQINQELRDVCQEIFELAGQRFNPNSPQQLSEALFSKMGLPMKGLRKTPGGVISTSASELLKLRGEHPIIEYLEKHRELAKLKSTYIEALPRLVNLKTGRLHAHFHQLGTETGRLSCSEPNLQNIPVRTYWGQRVRRAFVAQEGFGLVSVDYSQIELRIAAILSKDKTMLTAFRQAQDIHILTASQVLGVALKDVSPEQRYLAKRLNFGVLYGMGMRAFAASAGITVKEAKIFIHEYFQRFTGLAKYLEQTKNFAQQYGYVKTFFGRRRPLLQIHSRDPALRRSAERMAINMPIQGTAADLIKMAMVTLSSLLNSRVRLVCQIHDELLFEIKNDIILRIAPQLKQVLESVYQFPIILKTEVKYGPNWTDLKIIEI